NIDPEGYVLYTYAAIQIWAAAAARNNGVDPRRIAALLKSGGPWQTVLGDIGFDAKGDVTVPDYVFYVWRNGSYAEI
ncbi:MAG: branched-chain amino acid ABC transporter substrate-binding protein, partial [Roseomonas sp.]|nr:branched-chain amino acid ABC transporter substrate-binding protein [Roseomonas sp.]